MAFRLNVGQYFDAPSPIHALDARVKLCCALAGMVGLFCAATPAQLLLGAAFTLAVVAASRVPVGRVAASVRPLVLFLGVLSLFNLVFVQTGEVLLAAGPLTVTTGGAWAAVLYTIRFGLALMLGGLILLTTTPTQLSDAFDRMMAPLARLGLPAHEVAMACATPTGSPARWTPAATRAERDAPTSTSSAWTAGTLLPPRSRWRFWPRWWHWASGGPSALLPNT